MKIEIIDLSLVILVGIFFLSIYLLWKENKPKIELQIQFIILQKRLRKMTHLEMNCSRNHAEDNYHCNFCMECGERLRCKCKACLATWQDYGVSNYCPECGVKHSHKNWNECET